METYISHATELNSECNYIHFLREDGKYETDLSALEDLNNQILLRWHKEKLASQTSDFSPH
ncbi:MAG: hypothetical protein ACJ0BN_18785 [Limisphaerales bacterium]|nr:hypothetical protein [Pedosphaera sp.]MBL6844502.1 hypothetical protein [Verrucomicrobiae bacterium]RZO69322.1 MAG: hypothetical protein EVA71_08820 [Limisphaerales bacterium]HAW00458.1 hypothetical protein [Verrucomicrobiales bacterium]HCP37571.1 hypothetical protein [Verrucomicrobiales bacterium]|tara:strand:- start:1816 stop:1998 length:183 start_codon:yes stop_codon:yes gene_type:complete